MKHKKPNTLQATALYHIELDGGLMRTAGAEHDFTTARGRPIHAGTAQFLIDNNHLVGNGDGMFGQSQSWTVARPIGVVRRDDSPLPAPPSSDKGQ